MDFTKFINSRDVREHLKNIGYDFNSLEAAWLVWNSITVTYEEKTEAVRYIIENMPDMSIEGNFLRKHVPSLHGHLKFIYETERKWLKEMHEREDNTVYCISFYDESECNWVPLKPVFYELDTAETYIKSCFLSDPKELYRIKKIRTDDGYEISAATYRADGSLRSIDCYMFDSEDEEELFFFFYSLYLEFPVPFKRGDLLCNPYGILLPCEGPFVFEKLHHTNDDKNKKLSFMYYNMNADAYYFDPECNTELLHYCVHNYMDFEYYRRELTGTDCVLTAVSDYVKGKTDAAELCNEYMRIMTAAGDPRSADVNDSSV